MNAVLEMSHGPLVTFTIFATPTPSTKKEMQDVDWPTFVEHVVNVGEYPSKESCPLISMGEYGDVLTEKNCIRHADNVKRVYGVEIDYDGKQMPLSIGASRLRAARLRAVLHTSASHHPDAPRWRVLLPLSEPHLPTDRAMLVGRVNRALGGIASSESFTLSQSFYIGRVRGVQYETATTEGRCVDEAVDLEPLYYSPQAPSPPLTATGSRPVDPTTDADLRAAFERGADRYQAMLKLSSRWAARGMAEDDIVAALNGLFGDRDSHNADGIDFRERIPGIAKSAVVKFGETRAPRQHDAEGWGRDTREETDTREQIIAAMRADFETGPEAVDAAEPPEFIVDQVMPACGSNFAGSGGTSKTTLALIEAVHILGGGRLYGREVIKQAPCVLVTSEDGASYARYVLRNILRDGVASGAISERHAEWAKSGIKFIGWPRAKYGPLATVDRDGNLSRATAFDDLLELVRPANPALVTLDPLALLGPGERFGNDADAFVAAMAHEAAQSLGACVQFVDHVSQAVARGGIVDQYAARGGSAKTDNARLARQLTRLPKGETPADLPVAVNTDDVDNGRILQLHWTKSNYAPLPPSQWLRRSGFWIECLRATSREEAQEARTREHDRRRAADIDQVVKVVTERRARGDYPTARTLEDFPLLDEDGERIPRPRLRAAIAVANQTGRLITRDLPREMVRGARREFLDVGGVT
jgi:RecA-family ATPase